MARPCCKHPRLVTLSLFLCLSLSPMPFILRVPLDPAGAGPQHIVVFYLCWLDRAMLVAHFLCVHLIGLRDTKRAG